MTKEFKNTDQLLEFIGDQADRLGKEVYVVGGYLRDNLLGIEVKDLDFTVINDGVEFAREVAKELGVKNIVCYQKFGTCMIRLKNYKLEFVQARSEKYNRDSRNPIVKKGNLKTDLERRDFTINTLAKRLTSDGLGELTDMFNGQKDLENRILRTPLDPLKTFEDDPLRMLRAVRFVARYNFKIDNVLIEAIKSKCLRVKIVSQERITDEFIKIMQSPKPSIGLDLLRKTGMLKILFPDLHNLIGVEQRGMYHHKDVWFHTIKVVDNTAKVSDKLVLRLAALYHDIAKPRTKRFVENIGWTFHGHDALGAKMIVPIIRQLKLPKDYIPYLQKLIRLHLRPISLSDEGVTESAIRRLIVSAGEDLDDLLTLCRADITSGNPKRVKEHLKNFDLVEKRIQEVEEIDSLRTFQSPVDGNEIMKVCNLGSSPMVGKLKTMIEEAILDGDIPYDHDAAFDYLLRIKDEVLQKSNSIKQKTNA